MAPQTAYVLNWPLNLPMTLSTWATCIWMDAWSLVPMMWLLEEHFHRTYRSMNSPAFCMMRLCLLTMPVGAQKSISSSNPELLQSPWGCVTKLLHLGIEARAERETHSLCLTRHSLGGKLRGKQARWQASQKMTENLAKDPQNHEKKKCLFSLPRLIGQQEQSRNLRRAQETMNWEETQLLADLGGIQQEEKGLEGQEMKMSLQVLGDRGLVMVPNPIPARPKGLPGCPPSSAL